MLISGGVLGVYCHHNYAHAANSPTARIPSMLKGADAAMLAVCDTFKLKTQTRPVYFHDDDDDDDEDSDDGWAKDRRDRLKRIKLDPVALFDIKATSQNHHGKDKLEWVGDQFRIAQEDEHMGDYEEWLPDRLKGQNWVKAYSGIHWLNQATHKEANRAYLTVLCL
jgi:hypothetical protein